MEAPQSVRRRISRAQNGGGPDVEANVDLRKLLRALQAVRDGDFSARLPGDKTGLLG
jgi:hypothetical protein